MDNVKISMPFTIIVNNTSGKEGVCHLFRGNDKDNFGNDSSVKIISGTPTLTYGEIIEKVKSGIEFSFIRVINTNTTFKYMERNIVIGVDVDDVEIPKAAFFAPFGGLVGILDVIWPFITNKDTSLSIKINGGRNSTTTFYFYPKNQIN